MLSVIPVLRVISVVAATYGLLVTMTLFGYWKSSASPEFWTGLRIASSSAVVLDLALFAIVHFWWKSIWRRFPVLNVTLFPDLNGYWSMKIHWVGKDGDGVVKARAIIKQNFLRVSMEVQAERSDSETLMAVPKKDPESGRPLLYYLYRVVPKQIDAGAGAPYEGAAILKFDRTTVDQLNGNYFTSRQTRGHFVMTREYIDGLKRG